MEDEGGLEKRVWTRTYEEVVEGRGIWGVAVTRHLGFGIWDLASEEGDSVVGITVSFVEYLHGRARCDLCTTIVGCMSHVSVYVNG